MQSYEYVTSSVQVGKGQTEAYLNRRRSLLKETPTSQSLSDILRPMKLWTAIIFFAVLTTSFGQSSFLTETQNWRAKREAELKAEDGWLSVAGLFWLKEGLTTIGTDASAVDIVLPAGSASGQVGSLELANGTVTLKVKDNVVVTVKDKPVSEFVMKFDDIHKPPDPFEVGTLKLAVIKRANRYGLRVRDKNSPQRLAFKAFIGFLQSRRIVWLRHSLLTPNRAR